MVLKNNGRRTHALFAAFSPIAKQVKLRKIIKNNGQKRSVAEKSILIRPHKKQRLHAGSFYVALNGLDETLKNAMQVPVVLLFKDGSWVKVDATVA